MTDGLRYGTALVTGASSGIGAAYAERLARRGHALVLVARDAERLEALAVRLRSEAGVAVAVLPADLTEPAGLHAVETRLREDARIGLLVNNAGLSIRGGFAAPDLDAQERLVRLNVTAPMRLAGAALPRFLARGEGAIVFLGSVLALAPEIRPGIYPASKAFVLAFAQSLQAEFGGRGLYVQAVLPAATRTEIWARSGQSVEALPEGSVMEVADLVDAALVGFDRREPVTMPSLPDPAQWEAFTQARRAMARSFRQGRPAARYRGRDPVRD